MKLKFIIKTTTSLLALGLFIGSTNTVAFANTGLTEPNTPALSLVNTPSNDIPNNPAWQTATSNQLTGLEALQMQQLQQMGITMPGGTPGNPNNTAQGWWQSWPTGTAAGGQVGFVPPLAWGVDLNAFNSWDEYYAWLSQMGMSPWFGNFTQLPPWGAWNNPNQNWNWAGNNLPPNWNNWNNNNWNNNDWNNPWGWGPGFGTHAINFGSRHIEDRVRDQLNIHNRPITPQDVANVRELHVVVPNNQTISSNALVGMRYFTNLRYFSFEHRNPSGGHTSNLSNIGELSELRQLRELDLAGHRISSLTPLRNMRNLQHVDLRHNNIRNFDILDDLGVSSRREGNPSY